MSFMHVLDFAISFPCQAKCDHTVPIGKQIALKIPNSLRIHEWIDLLQNLQTQTPCLLMINTRCNKQTLSI